MDPLSLQCSPASNSSQGITANPDISGVGVRIAIYIQAVLTLVHAIVAGYDGKIDDFEVKSLVTVFLGILLPGCALLFSAIVQAKTFGLSAYHAMIVLLLSWINNTSALTFFAYIVGERLYGRPYQLFKESQKLNQGQSMITKLDSEWDEADTLGRLRILKEVQDILDKLNLDRSGTKSTSLTRELWELEIQKWFLWREMKIMTMVSNQVDDLEFLARWKEEWEENETKLGSILAEMRFGELIAKQRIPEIFTELRLKMRFVPNRSRSRSPSVAKKSIWLMAALASAHLILLSAFGLWFWSTLPNFGINEECIPSIRFVFFTKSIPITSKVLRSRSKSIYIFSSLPVINIFIWLVIFLWTLVAFSIVLLALFVLALPVVVVLRIIWVLIRSTGSSLERSDSHPMSFLAFMPRFFFTLAAITAITTQALFISLTELTIAHNRHLLQSKEGDWTFGQTLALTLTLIPLLEVVKFLLEKRPRTPKESGKDRESKKDEESMEGRESMEGKEGKERNEIKEGREEEIIADDSS